MPRAKKRQMAPCLTRYRANIQLINFFSGLGRRPRDYARRRDARAATRDAASTPPACQPSKHPLRGGRSIACLPCLSAPLEGDLIARPAARAPQSPSRSGSPSPVIYQPPSRHVRSRASTVFAPLLIYALWASPGLAPPDAALHAHDPQPRPRDAVRARPAPVAHRRAAIGCAGPAPPVGPRPLHAYVRLPMQGEFQAAGLWRDRRCVDIDCCKIGGGRWGQSSSVR